MNELDKNNARVVAILTPAYMSNLLFCLANRLSRFSFLVLSLAFVILRLLSKLAYFGISHTILKISHPCFLY